MGRHQQVELVQAWIREPGSPLLDDYRSILTELFDLRTQLENLAEAHAEHCRVIRATADRLGGELRRRTPKARLADRDREIVRLRDERGLTFGQIARQLLKINPAWCSKHGKPISEAACRQAYRRVTGRSG
jgi:hypothetical protein